MNTFLRQFENQKYLSMETFRKNGQGVKTPVWFAQDGETLRIWTQADSGKVKRIRRDGKVRISPSTGSGEPLGNWVHAQATEAETNEALLRTTELFKKKYGLAFNLFLVMGKMRKTTYTTLVLKPDPSS